MDEELDYYWKERILIIKKMHQYIKPEFSCTLCKAKVNAPTCNGCPIFIRPFADYLQKYKNL